MRKVFHVSEVELNLNRYCIDRKFCLRALAHIGEPTRVWLFNHVPIRVSDIRFPGQCDHSVGFNLVAVQLELNVNGAAEVEPETRAEPWDRVHVVKRVWELFLAALVEGWVGNVDVASCVEVGGAFEVNYALGADADVVLYVLGVARVLVRVVRVQHLVGVSINSEWKFTA